MFNLIEILGVVSFRECQDKIANLNKFQEKICTK
jgi:hypothetical protein